MNPLEDEVEDQCSQVPSQEVKEVGKHGASIDAILAAKRVRLIQHGKHCSLHDINPGNYRL